VALTEEVELVVAFGFELVRSAVLRRWRWMRCKGGAAEELAHGLGEGERRGGTDAAAVIDGLKKATTERVWGGGRRGAWHSCWVTRAHVSRAA
jgi:hypothetical protein